MLRRAKLRFIVASDPVVTSLAGFAGARRPHALGGRTPIPAAFRYALSPLSTGKQNGRFKFLAAVINDLPVTQEARAGSSPIAPAICLGCPYPMICLSLSKPSS